MKRLAIVDKDKCRPTKCRQECRSSCPPQRTGKKVFDIEDLKVAKISENLCIGCGICVHKCPFHAIKIVNIPKEIQTFITHRYGVNSFRLYKLPILKIGQIIGILGQNGIGKTTILDILSAKIRPNFEISKKLSDYEIISRFKGNELQKYLNSLYLNKFKIAYKPQHIYDTIECDNQTTIRRFLSNSYDLSDEYFKNVIKTLELDIIIDSPISVLSGGELQRLVCANVLLQKADVYIFDEFTNFLDITQRLNVAELIKQLISCDKYIIVVEHDLSILDYLADYICIIYGEQGAYGVVSNPIATSEAINIYFDGYIPSENIRFRDKAYKINDTLAIEYNDTPQNKHTYEETKITFSQLSLTIKSGEYLATDSIIIILGKNGSGKTTFIKYLEKTMNVMVSHKPQYLIIDKYIKKNGKLPTVEKFLLSTIKNKYLNNLFITDVIKPLNIDKIINTRLNDLSGGELQKVFFIHCLGQEAQIYLIDEPSACLDVEQRVLMTNILKRFVIHNRKICFLVEHDLTVVTSIAQMVNSQIIVFDVTVKDGVKTSVAHPPIQYNAGINQFLKILNITIRTDPKNNRPRVNKQNSLKDREQKYSNNYYC